VNNGLSYYVVRAQQREIERSAGTPGRLMNEELRYVRSPRARRKDRRRRS
jgi:hypothetical protein